MENIAQNNAQHDSVVNDLFGMFDTSAEDIVLTNDSDNGPSNFFNPDSAKAPDKVYSAKIKFLTNISNPKKGFAEVQKYVFDTPNGKFHYKSAKSLGRNEKCPVADKYWFIKGKDQKDARLIQLGKEKPAKVKWQSDVYALIQVVEDYSFPENTGKMFFWNVPKDVQKLVENELIPSAAQSKMGKKPNNVFDIVYGRVLMLDIPIKLIADDANPGKQKEVRDYSRCQFIPETGALTTMLLEGETAQRPTPVKGSPEHSEFLQLAYNTLTSDKALKLSDISYKPESEEYTQKVLAGVDALVALTLGTASAPAAQPAIQAPVQAPVQAQPAAPVQAAQAAPVQAQPEAPAATSAASNQILGSIFADANV